MCLAIPGRIVEIYEEHGLRMGKLDFGGTIRKCCLQCIPDALVGEYALVHVGFAISTVDAEEAARTYKLLEEMGEVMAQFDGEDAEMPCGSKGTVMKYLDEYRDQRLANKLVQEIERCLTRAWTIMEVCGGQTHSIVKYGIDYLLPKGVELVHGPGCPVCVTPFEMIDKAHAIASHPEVIFCSFGDMVRVPGSRTDLFRLKSKGADVRIVYSPLDCLRIAQSNPERQVVFFAIGFETTAPANAMTVHQALQLGIRNFSLLVSHVRVPPAITSILQSPHNRVQGFLGPGHVCMIMGDQEYQAISAAYKVPFVITGFEPLDILEGVLRVVRQLEEGRAEVENQYSRVVTHSGNRAAHDIIGHVFEVCDQKWREVGTIPQSGYRLQPEFKEYDAARVFAVEEIDTEEPAICISGPILTGLKKPHERPAFGKQCTPLHPLGATMVSAEVACAAYFNYGRHLGVEPAGSHS